MLQEYSEALNLYLRWDQVDLRLHDPATRRHIATFEDERARADRAEARAEAEYEAKLRAEARIRELEEENQRLRGG